MTAQISQKKGTAATCLNASISSWKDRLASFFVRSAQFVKIIDSDGVLRYTGNVQAATFEAPQKAEPRTPNPLDVHVDLIATDPAKPGFTNWSFKQLKVQTPETMSKELWEKLNAYVQILKPE